ncbi:hypothetical protein NHX12_012177 [Muraenolepis orangiensis]|uniref:Synaptopodin n=1 Tax=Muraenolepis orangiensis TaxID=630683 RepID=A0A9Q0DH77_9TELE|nr:hypothetical protein NHX12_012177 [Muraenolepis orangiensis]
MEKGHVSVRRGVSWSPGGGRKSSFQTTQDTHDSSNISSNAPWEKCGFQGQQTLCPDTKPLCRKTNLTRSASLSEKELKDARVRSQIIATQLTVPTNSSSRGVQLFNRRRQRVNSFTVESGGEGSAKDTAEHVKALSPCNKLRWAEGGGKQKDPELNSRNSRATEPLWSPAARIHRVGDIMEEPAEQIHQVEQIKSSVPQDRHFVPVNEEEEKFRNEEAIDRELRDLEENVKVNIAPPSDNTYSAQLEQTQAEEDPGREVPEPAPPVNSCHRTAAPAPSAKQSTIVNRTARPFFSPVTVQPPEAIATSAVMDTPSYAPSYATPALPTFSAPHRAAFSPPPPPPSYPMPPLPAFTNHPPQTYSNSACMSPIMSAMPPAVSQYTATVPSMSYRCPPSNPPLPYYGAPTGPGQAYACSPQPTEERKSTGKTGILEEMAAKRSTGRKSMFTFKEKPIVAPNPELLSLVQGADERKKHGHKALPEPGSEEELLALGAEASNFLVRKHEISEEASAPEWASSLKTFRTRAREEHRPEQTLTNVSGKGAELFAKRQSRMEKFVLCENQNAKQDRSPSPTMSLPPSWVFPSNMPGRVKAIAKNSEMSSQLTQTQQDQQKIKRKPRQQAPAPPPVPESPPLENGCTKIEMDLSKHQPYQLKSSLFILNPIKDTISTLPRAAPAARAPLPPQSFSRQTSFPISSPSHFSYQATHSSPSHFSYQATHSSPQCMSPRSPLSPTGRMEYPANYRGAPAHGQPRVDSPMSAVSPERPSSSRSAIQAPRPMFSARKAGIEPQVWRPSLYYYQ